MQLFTAQIVSGLNSLLSDNAMGGSDTCVGYHGLVFAMQLRKQLNSQQKLIDMLTDDHSTLVQTISGIKPLQTLVKVGRSTLHTIGYYDCTILGTIAL